ncbi:MAG: MFS transporter, partial [Fervidicoccus sp.]
GFYTLGIDAGVVASALIYITFKLSPIGYALIVSSTGAFAGIGALLSGPLVDKFGRKALLIADGVIFAIFSLTSALAVNEIMLIISRVAIGFGIGLDYAVSPVFISEFAPADKRGPLNTVEHLMLFLGTLSALIVGLVFSFFPRAVAWRWMFGVGAIPAIILIILRFWIPESPRWLVARGKIEEAKKSLKRIHVILNGKIIDVTKEKPLVQPLVKRAAVIVGFWVFFAIASGINVILYYGPYIWKYLGLVGSKAILVSLIIDSVGLGGYALAFFTIDKGVRRLSALGFAGLFIGMALTAIGGIYSTILLGLTIIFIGIVIFEFSFQALGNVEVVLLGTVFPTQRRGLGSGIGAAIAWFSSFFITLIFPLWLKAYGFTSFATLEAIIALAGLIWTLLLLPELKGVPLEAVNIKYSGKAKV